MDPTENLRDQLELANKIANYTHTGPTWTDPSYLWATELAERVLALNEWIRRGGFLPEQWTKKQHGLTQRGEHEANSHHKGTESKDVLEESIVSDSRRSCQGGQELPTIPLSCMPPLASGHEEETKMKSNEENQ